MITLSVFSADQQPQLLLPLSQPQPQPVEENRRMRMMMIQSQLPPQELQELQNI